MIGDELALSLDLFWKASSWEQPCHTGLARLQVGDKDPCQCLASSPSPAALFLSSSSGLSISGYKTLITMKHEEGEDEPGQGGGCRQRDPNPWAGLPVRDCLNGCHQ